MYGNICDDFFSNAVKKIVTVPRTLFLIIKWRKSLFLHKSKKKKKVDALW